MLNEETKRKINNARDVLVGKVPDPKAQVEQITLALMYKFMDDIDKKSIALGGKADFFVGDYQKYAWSRVMDPKLSGHERLHLYGEGLEKMRYLPDLFFQGIFKDAYLPYRSPDTLHLFLKEINGFKYEHSEDLGDAYEYLLSVLGSQGDAGQFRTPRHIIDFIVAAVNPQLREKICDPACGTAGFLISAYKHILAQNPEMNPDDRQKLAENIAGYDISPDMVRLSKANLYLHGFAAPRISEYDTLTSEERWEERFDVMLANPPFMTPKGGIRPHKRFAVQANRSEVLFVDYILEHLKPEGRAGIIVPEGIIFQAANAYKQLRKLLLEDGLLAVISLPAGVFNPYSGVKTSILLFDNRLAKRTDKLLFVKISRDGYDLGAQRREKPGENDLPQTLEIIKKYRQNLVNGEEPVLSEEEGKIAHLTPKEKIAENGDYNLSGDRYRITETVTHQKWPLVELGEVGKFEYGFTDTAKDFGDVRFIRITDIDDNGQIKNYDLKFTTLTKESGKYLLKKGDILVARTGATYGKTAIFKESYPAIFASFLIRIEFDKKKICPDFYQFFTKTEEYWEQAKQLATGGGQPQFNANAIKQIKIPLPPMEVQTDIVDQIEVKQKAINAAKAVIENLEKEKAYFSQVLKKLDNLEWVELGEVCSLMTGGTPKSNNIEYYENGKIKWLVSGDIHKGEIFDCFGRITELGMKESNAKMLPINSVLIALNGQGKTRGTVAILRTEATCNQSLVSITPINKDELIPEYLFLYLQSQYNEIRTITGDNQRSGLNIPILKHIKIPLPPLEIQTQLVAQAEQEQEIIKANQRLIALMEEKIQTVLADL